MEGKDVTALKAKLEIAKNKITDAATALGNAKAKFITMTASTDPKAVFKQVKDLVRGVEQKIKDAHHALVDVVKSIKGASGADKATTTP